MNHVPSVFGYENFEQVVGSHGGKSFKELMKGLLLFHKNLADGLAHQVMRRKESKPSKQSIEPCKTAIDQLIAEVIILLNQQFN